MNPILVSFTPEEAHNTLVMLDMALKHHDGGIKILKAASAVADKIKAATDEAQKPSPPEFNPLDLPGT